MAGKILITGGSGMIGGEITQKLLAQGYAINYLSRKPEKMDRVAAFHWNPEAGQFDEQALRDVDFIINLAGAGIADERWSSDRKKLILESRTKSTAFLRDQLRTSKVHNVKALISASGMNYYGYDNADNWQKEDSPAGDDYLANVVKAWEEEARMYEELGIRVVICRFGMVLSTKGGALPRMIKPIKLGAAAALGSGQQWMSWVHVEDLVGIVGFAINEDRISGIYNVVAPEPVTNKEFTKKAAEVMGKPYFLPNVPAFALRTALGEMSVLLLGSNRISSEKLQEEGYNFEYDTLDKALSNLLD
ncbi:MAG: TIGR01777 family oxidoreductase [Candidatus Cyclobacteriaceae bacterium M2_1C_046]